MMKSSAKSRDVIVAQYLACGRARAIPSSTRRAAREHAGEAGSGESWLELNDVRLFEFNPPRDASNRWPTPASPSTAAGWLRNVRAHLFRGALLGDPDRRRRALAVEPRRRRARRQCRQPVAPALPVRQPAARGHRLPRAQPARRQRVRRILLGRWFYPLNVLALCLAAIPFAFGSLRSGGLRRLRRGVRAGLLAAAAQAASAAVYKFDYRIAYLVPPAITSRCRAGCSKARPASRPARHPLAQAAIHGPCFQRIDLHGFPACAGMRSEGFPQVDTPADDVRAFRRQRRPGPESMSPSNCPAIPYSLLDPRPGLRKAVRQAFANALDLGGAMPRASATPATGWPSNYQHASIASAATAVLIGHVAGGTSTIRVGAAR